MGIEKAVELKDLIDLSFLQDFQDNFACSVGVASLTEDAYGNALTRPSRFSDFCTKLVRATPIGSKRCRHCDLRGAETVARTGKPTVYECHAGLIDFAAPIMLEGRKIGAIFGGQVLTEAPDEAKFRRIAREIGVDPDEYLAAIAQIPVVPREKVEAIARFLFTVANTLSEKAYQTLKIKERNRELVLTNNHLNNILQTMSDGVITFDEQGLISRVNPSAEQILGFSSQELIGHQVKNFLGESAHLIDKLLTHCDSFFEAEIMVEVKEGLVHCLASGKPIKDDQDNFTGGLLLVRHIDNIQRLVNRFSGAQATFQFKDIIGNSAKMKETIRITTLAAKSMSNVLLQGESGTGKELFAQAIHNYSPRRKGPFVAVNCGAIPRELIASELFGYEEGAFTGARRGGRPGKFELASGGTLFLDEIGDMPLEQQVALLRVLQEKQVTRIGSSKVIPVDVRVICATNKNLALEVQKGNFRQDLFYRINVIQIDIPPLREHPEDIPILFEHFLERIKKESGNQIKQVDPLVLDILKQYHWPGNVRELQNVVERMVNMAEDNFLGTSCLPVEIYGCEAGSGAAVSTLSPPKSICISQVREKRKLLEAEKERQELITLLTRYGGNISRIAEEMRCSRNTVYRKLKMYGIQD